MVWLPKSVSMRPEAVSSDQDSPVPLLCYLRVALYGAPGCCGA